MKLRRLLDVLALVARGVSPRRKFSASSVSAVYKELNENGMIEKDMESRRYRITENGQELLKYLGRL